MPTTNYLELIKRAWNITWKNKRLWLFGILIAITNTGSSFNFPSENKNYPVDMQAVKSFFSTHWQLSAALIIFGILFFLTFLVLGIIARGGLIKSVEKIQKKEGWSFKQGMREGKKYFWKIIGLNLLISFSVLATILVLTVPVVFLFIGKSYLIAIPLAILAFIIFIGVLIFAAYFKIFGTIYIILGEIKVYPALENAYRLFKNNWASSIIMGLLFIPISILMGIVILIILLTGAAIFIPLGALLFALLKSVGIVITLVIGLPILLACLIAVSSVNQVFSQTLWILFFQEIAKPKVEEKVEETIQELEKPVQPVALGGTTTSKID